MRKNRALRSWRRGHKLNAPESLRPPIASALAIENVPINDLQRYQNNPRLHPKSQIDKLARAIDQFGFLIPVLIDSQNKILAGHARLEAAAKLSLPSVPCIRASHLTEAQKRTFVILDNRLTEEAKWNFQLLAKEIEFLQDEGIDLTTTGFEIPEIEMIFDAVTPTASNPATDDALPSLAPGNVITRPSDLWILGDHRLFCGDARRRESFEKLLSGETAQLAFVDPPFNVKIRGHVSGKGRVKHREFVQASGEKTSAQFTKFLEETLGLLAEHSIDGAIHFICSDWRHLDEMLAAGRRTYRELKNVVVWNKTNAGMGSFYRSQHELIFVWKNGRGKHVNNIELGRYGRNRSNVWTYTGVNTFGRERLDELAMHPTVKPVALVADAIRDCSRRGDIVLDSFGGSGTTLIACEQTHRKGRLIELDPVYCDQIVHRWQKLTGKMALHGRTGQGSPIRREKSRERTSVGDRGYAVGYGKPPAASRFKPWQTGNARGRPKGHKNLKTLIRQAMTARISVQEGTSNRQVSKIEGVVLRQLQNALKGNDRSAMAVIRMALQLGFLDDVADGHQAEGALSPTDERILKELMARREGKRR